MGYDTKCYDLAEAFLSDEEFNTPANIDRLAQRIQDVIEDAIADLQIKERGGDLGVPYAKFTRGIFAATAAMLAGDDDRRNTPHLRFGYFLSLRTHKLEFKPVVAQGSTVWAFSVLSDFTT